jgi:outer membrane protein assembly factor BamB
LEFDNIDLLCREGEGIAMSRWVFARDDGSMSIDRWSTFARLSPGEGSVMVPRGCWSYAPRHQRRTRDFNYRRPLAVYRNRTLFGSLQETPTLYRRDFDLENGEEFSTRSMTGWTSRRISREGGSPWRSTRLAKKATWKVDPFGHRGPSHEIGAMALSRGRLFVVGSDGDLRVLNPTDGQQLAGQSLPPPVWDGLAIAKQRLFYCTLDGQVLCLGE